MNIIPEVIKFLPWKGPNDEIFEGNKTKVSLYIDRLEYRIKHTQEVTIERIQDDRDEADTQKSVNFCDEEGIIDKIAISGISKYVETHYNSKTVEPYKVHLLDIVYGGTTLVFTFSTEEEKNNLYTRIYNWKYGTKQ